MRKNIFILYSFLLIIAITSFVNSSFAQDNPEVQWADRVVFVSSEFSPRESSAKTILGKPNIMPNAGISSAAWMPKATFGRAYETIKLRYRTPMRINQVVINENFNSGLIVAIILSDDDENQITVYENKTPRSTNIGRLNHYKFKKTKFEVSTVELKVAADQAYNGMQIDAVGIMMSDKQYSITINEAENHDLKNLKPINLGENVNSSAYEIMPIISQDGEKLYFTRDLHPDNFGIKKNQDIWIAIRDTNGEFNEAQNIGEPLNNDYHNFALGLSTDENKLYVGNVYMPDGTVKSGLSVSKFDGYSWEKPEPILSNLKLKNNQVNYCFAPNGKTIIISANLEDQGFGENDLYAIFQKGDGSWSEPINLGETINTAGMDITPFLSADMSTMYFSTNARPGYGDYDIFITRRLDDTWHNWSEPLNIGRPLNTEGWDAYLTVPASGEYAYYTSSKQSYGQSDIFKLLLPQSLKPKVVTLITGKVLNMKDQSPVEAKIIYELLGENIEAGVASSNPNTGEYQIALPAGKLYGYLAEAEDYLSLTNNIDLTNETYHRTIYRDLYLVPVMKGANITINNLFFEFGKYELLPESFPELDRLAAFMLKETKYKVLISGHTDDIGTDALNMQLSKQRANAVVNYLISKGVPKNRLQAKGYGKTQPVRPNDTEEDRSQNRRVEFQLK